MRRILVYILVFSVLLIAMGCYTHTVVPPDHASVKELKIETVILASSTRIDFDNVGGKYMKTGTLEIISGINRSTGALDSIDLKTVKSVSVTELDMKAPVLFLLIGVGATVVVFFISHSLTL